MSVFYPIRELGTTKLLFCKFIPPLFEVLHLDKAHQCDLAKTPPEVRGYPHSLGFSSTPPHSILSLLLTIPTTTAQFIHSTSTHLHLRCVDRSIVTLQLSLELHPIPLLPLHQALTNALIASVASLEGVVSELNKHIVLAKVDTYDKDSIAKLQGALVGGVDVTKSEAFRRLAADDVVEQAPRALAIARQTVGVKREIDRRRRERKLLDSRRREIELNRVKREMSRGQKKQGKLSLFDGDPPEDNVQKQETICDAAQVDAMEGVEMNGKRVADTSHDSSKDETKGRQDAPERLSKKARETSLRKMKKKRKVRRLV